MRHTAILLSALLVLALLLGATAVLAQTPSAAPQQSTYDFSWHVVAGGGGQVEAGDYSLGGTAGQPLAGLFPADHYTLCAGFWCGMAQAGYEIYLPLVLRNQGL